MTNVDIEGLNDYNTEELAFIADACKCLIEKRHKKKQRVEAILSSLKANLDELIAICDYPFVVCLDKNTLYLDEIYNLIKKGIVLEIEE